MKETLLAIKKNAISVLRAALILGSFAQDPQVLQRNNPDLYHKLTHTYNLQWGI